MRLVGLLITAASVTATAHTDGIIVNGTNNRRYHCPEGFIRLASSCYYLSVYMNTWQGAEFTCQDKSQSHLATPDRKWKDRRLKQLLNLKNAVRLERWIGGIFDWGRNKWVWGMTGRPIKYQGFSRKNKKDNSWHCIAMDPVFLYRWKSESCVERKHFICELPLRNIGAKPNDIYPKRRKDGKRKKGRRRNKESNKIV